MICAIGVWRAFVEDHSSSELVEGWNKWGADLTTGINYQF